jgi:predicted nucleic acid-binding protein
MVRRLVDASAIIAVIGEEPDGSKVIEITKGSIIVFPYVVQIEILNALTRMMRKKTITKEGMLKALHSFQQLPIEFMNIDSDRVIEIAWNYKIYAYEACYLEVAQRLNLSLITFDAGMARVGKDMGLTILGGKDANI